MTDKEMLQAMSDMMDEKFKQHIINIASDNRTLVSESGDNGSGFVTKSDVEQVFGGINSRVTERIKRMGEEIDVQYEILSKDIRNIREEVEKWETNKQKGCCCKRRYLTQPENSDMRG